jgi:hypothetical protein
MADARISRSDIEQLAQKLDTLRGHFAADEWTQLSAVLGAAIETMGRPGSAGTEGAAAGAAGASRPPAITSYDPGTDTDPDPDKIGDSMYDHVLSSFTAGADETSTDPGPDKIGQA